ncbi:unnamed protein product, partial [marine sediment metagenome]
MHYNFDLTFISAIGDTVLGEMSVIEYGTVEGIDTIFIGMERLAVGRMDVVIGLSYSIETYEWIEIEISDFDEVRFRILDLLFINDENLNKLIIASDTGIFETKISYNTDQFTITDPVCFTKEIIFDALLHTMSPNSITISNSPICSVEKITYYIAGYWYEAYDYDFANSEIRIFDSNFKSVWSSIERLKIEYSYLSFSGQEKKFVDPSLHTYKGTTTSQNPSAMSMFYKDSSLPLMWLNPTSTITDPFINWRDLDNFPWNERG